MALANTSSYKDQNEEEGSFIAKTSNGGVTYGLRNRNQAEEKKSSTNVINYNTTPEEDARNAKLALLASSDKDTIETQQKRLITTKQELDEVKAKFQILKRNYDSLSLFHAKDNAEFQKLKAMKEDFERQIEDLTKFKENSEEVIKKAKVETLH
jgi:hypothetical protein